MEYSFKYKKQMVLFGFGLRDACEFKDNVIVIQKSKEKDLKYTIQEILISVDLENNKIIIIKVPRGQKFKLPNLIIAREEDLHKIDSFLVDIEKYQEVWLCIKKIRESSVAGRFIVDWKMGIENQIVELIEGNYPRMLELVKSNENRYCMWTRSNWNTGYINAKDAQICDVGKKVYILIAIERKRKQFEEFCAFAERSGIYSVSFDFILSNEKFVIIDWDTENDCKLIRNYECYDSLGLDS